METTDVFENNPELRSGCATGCHEFTCGDRCRHCGLTGKQAAMRTELIQGASASPAQEAPAKWVPRKGDKVRVKSATASPTRSAMGEGGITVGYVGEVQSFAGEHEVEVNGWWINRCDLEPAPMPSGSAGKEEPVTTDNYGVEDDELARLDRARREKPVCRVCHAPYTPNDYSTFQRCGYCEINSHESLLLAVDNRPALRYWKEPTAERRARLHPHEGRSDRVYLANRKP